MNLKFLATSPTTVFGGLTATVAILIKCYNKYVPEIIHEYIQMMVQQILWSLSFNRKKVFTLVVNQFKGDFKTPNRLYEACEVYISDKLWSNATSRLMGTYDNPNKPISYRVTHGEEYVETLENSGITLVWKLVCKDDRGEEVNLNSDHSQAIELSFNLADKSEVLDNHIPSVVVKYYEDVMRTKKDLSLFTFDGQSGDWKRFEFNHPFTFDKLALDTEKKQDIIDDLDLFTREKERYKRAGRAWKRGYCLFGPPGTGKSSLIAAIANYLKYDVYDLQLRSVTDDDSLRRLMLTIKNRSILVIEDIDCTLGMFRPYNFTVSDSGELSDSEEDGSDKECHCQYIQKTGTGNTDSKVSLSAVLNFVDGLWSGCVEERIIIFTTNEREKVDQALLREGRMDVHIHMSYLTPQGFRVLVKNYLGITEEHEHARFKEIEQLLQIADATPAQVAEQLIRRDDPDTALFNLVKMLKKKVRENERKVNGKTQKPN